jgi:hypothetical protein
VDNITLRRWRTLHYLDPAEKLRRLRALERDLAYKLRGTDLEPLTRNVLALRTPDTKKYREWRDAALFTYGMGLALGAKIGFATEETSDYDFVTAREEGGTALFCAVQLKELPPAERNPEATVDGLLLGLPKKYAPTQTVLAVRLSRAGHVDLARAWPAVPFAGLWFFWASAPSGNKWSIYGDALGTPGQWAFDYPA